MGVTVANVEEVRDTQGGVTVGWRLRLHQESIGVATEPRPALGTQAMGLLVRACRVSAPAADAALAQAWPSWWGGLDPAFRGAWAAQVHAYALGATWWP